MKVILMLGLALSLSAATLWGQTAEPVSKTFNAPLGKVWTVTESVLKSLGWDIDEKDQAVGWIRTDSRGVEFKDFGVYGEGTRHRLRLTLKSVSGDRTSVSIERELYREERILWFKDRKPVPAKDKSVENAVLSAIERSL
jgi:hypothetical protein